MAAQGVAHDGVQMRWLARRAAAAPATHLRLHAQHGGQRALLLLAAGQHL